MYGANFPRLAYDEAPLGNNVGKNSEVIAKGDFLTLSSGFVAVAGAASIPLGIADCSKTMASDNQTVAKVQVPYLPAETDMMFEADFNTTVVMSAAYNGYLFKLTGTTGAMQIDSNTASTTVGVVELVKLDPRGEGSAVRGLFRFARSARGYTVAT